MNRHALVSAPVYATALLPPSERAEMDAFFRAQTIAELAQTADRSVVEHLIQVALSQWYERGRSDERRVS